MGNMNNQGKSKDQLKSSILGVFIGWIGILLLTLLMLLTSCSTKTHVITEWDGNRQINWYTTDK